MTKNTAVKLSGDIILEAKKYANVYSRSVSKQIEHWAKIGRIAEENPDLPYSFIKDILISMEEMKTGKPVPYQFGWTMQVFQYPAFEKVVKKLHSNAKQDLDNSLKKLIKNPLSGEMKKSDLNGIRVYKFKMVNQLTLVAYIYNETDDSISLLAIGSHENFYRDLKKENR